MSCNTSTADKTVYVSNLPYSLTQNDVHTLFSGMGHIVKVKVLRDKVTRRSRGVAFIEFRTVDHALYCVASMNFKLIGDRLIKCSMAIENGKSTNFIRRVSPTDYNKCFECGLFGHLSYTCPKNIMGNRIRRRNTKNTSQKWKMINQSSAQNEDSGMNTAENDYMSGDEEEEMVEEHISSFSQEPTIKKKIYKKSSYFSDEEYLSE